VQIIGKQYLTDGDAKRYDSLALLVKARNSILVNPVYDPNKPMLPGFPTAAGPALPLAAAASAATPVAPRLAAVAAPQTAPLSPSVTQRSAPSAAPASARPPTAAVPSRAPGPAVGASTAPTRAPARAAAGPPATAGAAAARRPPAASGVYQSLTVSPSGAGGGNTYQNLTTVPASSAAASRTGLTQSGSVPNDYDEGDYAQLMDMGFSREEAFAALQNSGGNIEQALDQLMGGGGGAPAAAPSSAAVVALGPKPTGVTLVAKGDGSSTKQYAGAATSGMHGAWGVTDNQNPPHKNYMEDGFAVVPVLEQTAAASYSFFGVYDGHSGREATEYAQDTLHLNLLSALRHGLGVEEAHQHAYVLTDNELLAMGVKTAGCTVVTALIAKSGGKRLLHVANAGDGRAVLCKAGRAIRMSFDHKVEVESETKRILALGGTILWGRVQGQTMVSRSLGDHDLKKFVIADPHFKTEPLDATCEFLVLACDGIWDVSDDQEVVDVVRKAGTTDPKAASAALIQHVIAKQTKDNLTAMVIALQ
jgi:protein phosphatase PTC1